MDFTKLVKLMRSGASFDQAMSLLHEDDEEAYDNQTYSMSMAFFLRSLEWAREMVTDDTTLHRFIEESGKCLKEKQSSDSDAILLAVDFDKIKSELGKTKYRNYGEGMDERELSYKARKRLPDSAFVFPKERKYPIHDLAHARNALARVAQFGSAAEQKAVRAAVYARYPQLKPEKKEKK